MIHSPALGYSSHIAQGRHSRQVDLHQLQAPSAIAICTIVRLQRVWSVSVGCRVECIQHVVRRVRAALVAVLKWLCVSAPISSRHLARSLGRNLVCTTSPIACDTASEDQSLDACIQPDTEATPNMRVHLKVMPAQGRMPGNCETRMIVRMMERRTAGSRHPAGRCTTAACRCVPDQRPPLHLRPCHGAAGTAAPSWHTS